MQFRNIAIVIKTLLHNKIQDLQVFFFSSYVPFLRVVACLSWVDLGLIVALFHVNFLKMFI